MKYWRVFIFLGFFLFGFSSLSTVYAETIPNDPFATQWAYKDTGLYEAWDRATGSSDVVVAIIDDGFDSYHPDLADNVWKNVHEIPDNGIDDDHNGYIDDVYGWNFSVEDTNGNGIFEDSEQIGNNDPRPSVLSYTEADTVENSAVHHGTLVAGIIGAVGNNGIDGAGINWHVKLMNVKVIGNSGSGVLLGLPRAIRYAVDNGADVINMSLVGSEDPLVGEAVKYAYDHGVVVVAAAGNDMVYLNTLRRFPVCADAGQTEKWVLGVSAIGENHRIARFSNVGSDCVDITAPGIGISSTVRFAPSFGLRSEYSGNWQGTSFAAPFVSGAAALVKSIQPSWGAKEIFTALLSTTHKTPPKDEAEYADLFGAGLIQIQKAVAYAFDHPRIIPSIKNIRALVAVAPGIGTIVQKNMNNDPVLPPQTIKAFAKLGTTAVFVDKGKTLAAVLSYPSSRRLSVTIYNQFWSPIRTWTVPVRGTWRITAGDVTGDGAAEIILAPVAGDTTLVKVFSTTGQEIKTIANATKHAGMSALTLVPTASSTNDIVLTYREGKQQFFSRINGQDWSTSVRFAFANNVSVLDAAVIDLDGDGVDEYAVMSKTGTVEIAVYSPLGQSILRFSPYDNPAMREARLVVADYDHDGLDDFIVSPVGIREPVRVWSSGVHLVDEWWPFGDTANAGSSLFPVYVTRN